MRYRPLDALGDYTLGVPFLLNTPACVAQACLTRLGLYLNEWFLDPSDGTPWYQNVLGKQQSDPNIPIRQRILGTPGVVAISAYTSKVVSPRTIEITCTVVTLYDDGTGNNTATFSTTITG